MASQGWPAGVTWNFTLLVMLLFAGCGGSGGDSGGKWRKSGGAHRAGVTDLRLLGTRSWPVRHMKTAVDRR